MNTKIRTIGEIEKIYGSYEKYRQSKEGLLGSIEACKSLIEDEKDKLIEIDRLYVMGEPIEIINAEKAKVAKAIDFYMKKIKECIQKLSTL